MAKAAETGDEIEVGRRVCRVRPSGAKSKSSTNYLVLTGPARLNHAEYTTKNTSWYGGIREALHVLRLEGAITDEPRIAETKGEACIDGAFGNDAERIKTFLTEKLGMNLADQLLVVSMAVDRKNSLLKKAISSLCERYNLGSAFYSVSKKKE